MIVASFRAALVALALLFCALPVAAAPGAPPPVKSGPLAKVRLHAEYVVSVNGKGEVVRVLSKKLSQFTRFDLMTYGNAVQTFIRTDTGHVVVGTFRLLYDYDPKHDAVRRDVVLVSRGGVNPNAESAVSVMKRRAKSYSKRDSDAMRAYLAKHPQAARTPVPRSDGTPPPLPSLQKIVAPGTPATR